MKLTVGLFLLTIKILIIILSSLRTNASKPQDVFLLQTFIFNNILNNDEIVENKSWLQPKKIGVHDFIMSLPDNYDFDVKNAELCSHRQRQLIVFWDM
jgi:ABC-type multidrug transport system fused ATPase/permease subunit